MSDSFNYAIIADDGDVPEVALTFADGRVLLPGWVIETIGYLELDEDEVAKLEQLCSGVEYSRFLARIRDEGRKLEIREARASLNRIQARYVHMAKRNIQEARARLRRLARRPWQRPIQE